MIAVCLCAYNGGKWITQQIESVIAQNLDLEIIVSIDKSYDDTYKIVTQLSLKYGNIKILKYGEVFGSAAKNFFRILKDYDYTKYDYISLCDQDDIWMQEKLSNSINLLKSSNFHVYSSNVTAFWENKNVLINTKKSVIQKKYDYLFEAAGPGCTYVMKNTFFSDLINFLKNNDTSKIDRHDWFFYAYARFNNYKWYIDKSSYCFYRQHKKNSVGINYGIPSYFNRVKQFTNGYWFEQSKCIIRILDIKNPVSNIIVSYKKNVYLLKLLLKSYQCRRDFGEVLIFFLLLNILILKQFLNKNE